MLKKILATTLCLLTCAASMPLGLNQSIVTNAATYNEFTNSDVYTNYFTFTGKDHNDSLYSAHISARKNGKIEIFVACQEGAWHETIGTLAFDPNYLEFKGYTNRVPEYYGEATIHNNIGEDGREYYDVYYPYSWGLDKENIMYIELHTTDLGSQSNIELELFDKKLMLPYAMDTTIDGHTPMYTSTNVTRFYFGNSIFAEDYRVVHSYIHYYIDESGAIHYELKAGEDVEYTAKDDVHVVMQSTATDIEYDAPDWCNYPRTLLNNVSNLISSKLDVTNYEGYMNQSFSSDSNNANITYGFDCDLERGNTLLIHKGDTIGTWCMMPESEVPNNTNSTISFTIDETTISKDIGNNYYTSDVSVYKKGDVNGDDVISVSDVVLLQKYLLGVTDSLDNWRAADLCKDNELNVFDLCVLKRMLIEKSN